MLRRVIIGYGLLYLIGAAILLFLVHATLWLVVYLAVNGFTQVECNAFGAQEISHAGGSNPGVLATHRRAVR
jgi:hypothetical protein